MQVFGRIKVGAFLVRSKYRNVVAFVTFGLNQAFNSTITAPLPPSCGLACA